MDMSDLREAPWNPRAIDEASLAALGASQRAFGDISGVVFNTRLGVLICGHQRLKRLRAAASSAPKAAAWSSSDTQRTEITGSTAS